jgi:hypothetical protein
MKGIWNETTGPIEEDHLPEHWEICKIYSPQGARHFQTSVSLHERSDMRRNKSQSKGGSMMAKLMRRSECSEYRPQYTYPVDPRPELDLGA